jgi:hypothetical protein
MRHVVEALRMLGFVGAMGAAMGLISSTGCERNRDIIEIETPGRRIDVEQRPDGGVEIDVDRK